MADYGVVIGVDPNPVGFEALKGPGNDAKRFHGWLIDPDGGGVPSSNVSLCGSADPTHPSDEAGVRSAFRPIAEMTTQGVPQQDRLFIYVSGHGLGDLGNSWDTGLVVSDADSWMKLHIAVNRYADFLYRSQLFKQVIFLADCCRDVDPRYPIIPPQLPRFLNQANAMPPRRFYGAAAHWGIQAKETTFGSVTHGYFTKALLDAFDHALPDDKGNLNGTNLSRFVHSRIGDWRNRSASVPIPEFLCDSVMDVHFGKARAIPFPMKLNVDAAFDGKKAEIYFDGQGIAMEERTLSPGPLTWGMKPGLYMLKVQGTTWKKPIEVPSDPIIDVS